MVRPLEVQLKSKVNTLCIAPSKSRVLVYARVLTRESTYRADRLKVLGQVRVEEELRGLRL